MVKGTPALDARKGQILSAIIQEYIHSAEPVASDAVLRRSGLAVSSATVRNEMGALEEMGFLSQPHTSAGRVPTDRGYRFYVDSLLSEERLEVEERHRLRRQIHSLAAEAERLIQGAARALAEEVHYPSVIATVRPQEQMFRHLHFVPLDHRRVLGVLLTDAGVFEGQPVDLPEPIDPETLDRLSRGISSRLEGLTLGEITRERLEALVGEMARYQRLFDYIRRWFDHEVSRAAAGQVIVEGATHLLDQPEFRHLDLVSAVLATLDRAEDLAAMLRPVPGRSVWVTIGSEMAQPTLRECSLVAATYSVGGRTSGTLAILGPRRMPYERAVPLVRFLARNLGEALTRQSA
jgi:heat-inducible transcriptional repressor